MRGPDRFSISFVQARPIALLTDIPRTMAALEQGGFRKYPLDYFYDTQLERNDHIGRAVLDRVTLSLADHKGNLQTFTGNLHLLIWSVGFVVFRLTFNDEGLARPSTGFLRWFKAMHALEHDLAPDGSDKRIWTAEFNGSVLQACGGVRRFFDLIAYAVHEHLCGRQLFVDKLSSIAHDMELSFRYLENLTAKGELRFPYVCTFGSHSEMIWNSSRTLPKDPDAWIPTLMGSGLEGERMAANIDEHISGKWWYLSEFQSIVVKAETAPQIEADVYDGVRTSMIEYIAYRRGGLMAIQRETYGITAERRIVRKREVADWTWLLSAVTNDYVLGGWSSTLFERVRQRFLAFDGLRNMFDLEAQVSKNIDGFQGRLDAESDRTGVITGVLFGIVAATALVPVGQLVIQHAFHLRGTYSNFPDNYPLVFLAVIAAMIAIVGAVSWGLLRRTRSLRPPRAGLGWLIRRGGRQRSS
jgi:hypothetical protein